MKYTVANYLEDFKKHFIGCKELKMGFGVL